MGGMKQKAPLHERRLQRWNKYENAYRYPLYRMASSTWRIRHL